MIFNFEKHLARKEKTKGLRQVTKDEQDISFNKMTEGLQKTTISNDYVDNIISSMHDILVVLSPNGKIQTVNRNACDLLGYREKELVERRIITVFAEKDLIKEIVFDKLLDKGFISNTETAYL